MHTATDQRGVQGSGPVSYTHLDVYKRQVLVEGGAELLGHFVRSGLWDEARVITGDVFLGLGTKAPVLHGFPERSQHAGGDRITFHTNHRPNLKLGMIPDPAWPW